MTRGTSYRPTIDRRPIRSATSCNVTVAHQQVGGTYESPSATVPPGKSRGGGRSSSCLVERFHTVQQKPRMAKSDRTSPNPSYGSVVDSSTSPNHFPPISWSDDADVVS